MDAKKPLHLVLCKEPYDLILCGKKRIEYRDLCDHWCRRIDGKQFSHALMQLGYKNPKKFLIEIKKIEKNYREALFLIYLGRVVKEIA